MSLLPRPVWFREGTLAFVRWSSTWGSVCWALLLSRLWLGKAAMDRWGSEAIRRRREGRIDADERNGSDRFRRGAVRAGRRWKQEGKKKSEAGNPAGAHSTVSLFIIRFSDSAKEMTTQLLPCGPDDWYKPMKQSVSVGHHGTYQRQVPTFCSVNMTRERDEESTSWQISWQIICQLVDKWLKCFIWLIR